MKQKSHIPNSHQLHLTGMLGKIQHSFKVLTEIHLHYIYFYFLYIFVLARWLFLCLKYRPWDTIMFTTASITNLVEVNIFHVLLLLIICNSSYLRNSSKLKQPMRVQLDQNCHCTGIARYDSEKMRTFGEHVCNGQEQAWALGELLP